MLNIEKLIKYFSNQNPEKVRAAGELVNKLFPDAKGYPSEDSPDCLAYFTSNNAVYKIRFSNCKIYFAPQESKVLNPPYWYDPWTKEVNFKKKMRRDHLVYRKGKRDGKAENWKDKANRKAKEKKERVDELLIASRSNKGLSFDSSSNSNTNHNNSVPVDKPPESKKQPIKIESLDDIRKVNKERKPKPKQAKPKKAKLKSKTKGMW